MQGPGTYYSQLNTECWRFHPHLTRCGIFMLRGWCDEFLHLPSWPRHGAPSKSPRNSLWIQRSIGTCSRKQGSAPAPKKQYFSMIQKLQHPRMPCSMLGLPIPGPLSRHLLACWLNTSNTEAKEKAGFFPVVESTRGEWPTGLHDKLSETEAKILQILFREHFKPNPPIANILVSPIKTETPPWILGPVNPVSRH